MGLLGLGGTGVETHGYKAAIFMTVIVVAMCKKTAFGHSRRNSSVPVQHRQVSHPYFVEIESSRFMNVLMRVTASVCDARMGSEQSLLVQAKTAGSPMSG